MGWRCAGFFSGRYETAVFRFYSNSRIIISRGKVGREKVDRRLINRSFAILGNQKPCGNQTMDGVNNISGGCFMKYRGNQSIETARGESPISTQCCSRLPSIVERLFLSSTYPNGQTIRQFINDPVIIESIGNATEGKQLV